MTRPSENQQTVEALARQFHETYERLAPEYGYETRPESAVPWEAVPENNRALMQAVVAEVLCDLVAQAELAAEMDVLARYLKSLTARVLYEEEIPIRETQELDALLARLDGAR